ncbi:MAG: PASTA domain-containing protein [Oscillospiraceae bacterium]|nr:PASTA domain-containing protein [Oscillospiraceae bacterium]
MERFNLCYGCMNPLSEDAEICPDCGYRVGAPHLPSYLAPGVTLNDRYLVGKLKSYNGESACYIAFDKITESKVLIKEYMPDTLCTREKGTSVITVNPDSMPQYKTFLSEFVELNKVLSKMRTLNHINAAIDMFGDNNTAYAVFSWLDGMTMSEYLKMNAGELSWEEVKKLFPPIFTTLSLVHNAGLVHRGISPENIIVTDKGELKLTGFCIADARTANTELASELYNGYAAPEQYNSSNWQGTWTDVYGISALLYRILTGVVPTEATSRLSSDNLIEPAGLNRNIPANVSKVIMNGLTLSGEMRIQTITELVTQLFEQPEYGSKRLSSSSTQTISIPRQSTAARSHSGSRSKAAEPISRNRLFVLIMAVILIVGLFFLVMIMILSLDDNSGTFGVPDSGLASISDTGEIAGETTTMSAPAPMEQTTTTAATTAADNGIVYVMNEITGKSYDLISKSDAYSSLVFKPEYEYNDEFGKGLIFYQSIPKTETYKDGTEILVKVSLGPKYIEIPDYLALSKKDYFAKLNELGIKYEEQELETEDTLEGYVAKTSKEPGEKIDVEAGETLTVYVAKNPPKPEPTETEIESLPPPLIEEDPFEGFITPYPEDEDIIITIYD